MWITELRESRVSKSTNKEVDVYTRLFKTRKRAEEFVRAYNFALKTEGYVRKEEYDIEGYSICFENKDNFLFYTFSRQLVRE